MDTQACFQWQRLEEFASVQRISEYLPSWATERRSLLVSCVSVSHEIVCIASSGNRVEQASNAVFKLHRNRECLGLRRLFDFVWRVWHLLSFMDLGSNFLGMGDLCVWLVRSSVVWGPVGS